MTVLTHGEPIQAVTAAATCPLCHTVSTLMSDEALAAGGAWRCKRCGQMWDAKRLATAAAYERYVNRLPK